MQQQLKAAENDLPADAKKELLQIIARHSGKEGTIINVLHDTQELLGYLPYSAQKFVAEEMNVPLAEIYGIATFYSRFSLTPMGKYKISVCLGTACYVKGAQAVLEKIEGAVGIKAGNTSPDGTYSVAATRCVGACGLAPVMTINEDVYGKLTPDEVEAILAKYK